MALFTYGSIKSKEGGFKGAVISPEEWGYAFTEGIKDAIEDTVLKIATKAAEDAPFKTGALRSSCDIVQEGNEWKITFSAFNPKDGYNYALVQHEAEKYVHPNGGKDHYLSDAYEEYIHELPNEMARRAKSYSQSYATSHSLPDKVEMPTNFGQTSVSTNISTKRGRAVRKRAKQRASKKGRR